MNKPWKYRCLSCGKAMFYMRYKPLKGDKVSASLVYVKKGLPKPIDGNPITCQFCKWILPFGHTIPIEGIFR